MILQIPITFRIPEIISTNLVGISGVDEGWFVCTADELYSTAWWEMKLVVYLEAALEIDKLGEWKASRDALRSNMANVGDKLKDKNRVYSIRQKSLVLSVSKLHDA